MQVAVTTDQPDVMLPNKLVSIKILPRVYLEHDPPQEHPTNTRHWVQDPGALLVHCTHFNALMWDAGVTPTRIVEHGVKPLTAARYDGSTARGLVVINHLARRGRRLGLDLYQALQPQVPLALAGMGSEGLPGGLGEKEQLRHRYLPTACRTACNTPSRS